MIEKRQYDNQFWGTYHPQKEWNELHRCWIRKRDCELAQRFGGYQWYKLDTPKTDNGHCRFEWVLSNKKPDARYVLEPDTHVPSFSANLMDAIKMAQHMGLKHIAVLHDQQSMVDWIIAACEAEARKEEPNDQ